MPTSAWSTPWTVVVPPNTTPSITTSPGALAATNVGADYLVALGASGPGPYTWRVSSGALPAGLSLNPSAGTIYGRATTATGSPFSFSLIATNAVGDSAAVAFTIAVGTSTVNTPAEIASLALPTATVGSPYSYQLLFNGTTPITVASTSLPSGWSLSSGGLLTHGNPGATLTNYSITFTPSNTLGAGTPKTMLLNCIAAAPAPDTVFRHITDRSGAGPFAKRTIR